MITSMSQRMTRCLLVLLLVALVGLSAAYQAQAFDSDKAEIDVIADGVDITVFTYRPSGCEAKALLFIFHGLGRKAENIRDNAIPLADRNCLLVLAPLFDEDRFPNWRYHRAGVVRKERVQPKERWTAPIVSDLIIWGREWADDRTMPYLLFGHSAGAQFLSRLSAYSPPADAARIVIANPSVHVLPSLDEAAPYGFGRMGGRREAIGLMKAYLALPITIYLGDQDTGSKNLVKKPAANRQGANRLERGLNVFRLAWQLTRERGWQLNWRLVTAPGIGHSSRGMLSANAAEQAFGLADSLFADDLEREFQGEHAR